MPVNGSQLSVISRLEQLLSQPLPLLFLLGLKFLLMVLALTPTLAVERPLKRAQQLGRFHNICHKGVTVPVLEESVVRDVPHFVTKLLPLNSTLFDPSSFRHNSRTAAFETHK